MTIAELIDEAHETAKSKGWWDSRDGAPDRNMAEQIALMHSELSEALEEWRAHGLREDAFLYTEQLRSVDHGEQPVETFLFLTGDKPEGIAAELADVLIRIADTCGRYGIPLESALLAKLRYNKTRPHRHGGKLA